MRLRDVLGPDASAQAVFGVVGDLGDLVQIGKRSSDQDRAEDLLTDDLHVGARVGQRGRLDEVAAVAVPAAAGQRSRAVSLARLQVAADPPELLLGYQRAHLRAWLHPRPQLDGLGDRGDAVDYLVKLG